MKFWQLNSPGYQSDYQDANVNGEIDQDLSFPAVDCDICMMSWGWAELRSIPFECPPCLRGEMSTPDGARTLLREEHAKLQSKVFQEANINGIPFVDIRPGYRFPPLYLDIPSRPRADFLWPFSGLLVSSRIRDLLVDLCRDDVVTSPVVLRKVGKRTAKLPAPIPASGEPEDIINEAALLDDPSSVGPY